MRASRDPVRAVSCARQFWIPASAGMMPGSAVRKLFGCSGGGFAALRPRAYMVGLCASGVPPSVVVLKFLSLLRLTRHRHFKTKNHTRIIKLLVSFSNPKFVLRAPG